MKDMANAETVLGMRSGTLPDGAKARCPEPGNTL